MNGSKEVETVRAWGVSITGCMEAAALTGTDRRISTAVIRSSTLDLKPTNSHNRSPSVPNTKTLLYNNSLMCDHGGCEGSKFSTGVLVAAVGAALSLEHRELQEAGVRASCCLSSPFY